MGFFEPNIKKMIAKKDVEGLIKALKHKNWVVRCDAAGTLGKIKNKRAIEALIETLKDEEGLVGRKVAFALGTNLANRSSIYQQHLP